MRRLTVYPWHTGKLRRPMRIMVISDLHNDAYADLLPMFRNADALLVPGDLADRYHQQYENGLSFLREASEVLPTFVSIGNHERRLRSFDHFCASVRQTRAQLLINRYIRFRELVIGGWYRPALMQQPDFLPAMESEDGVRILLSHHPEDYIRHLRTAKVDLVLSGHAHGGQIRIGNQGLYAPGQGILPRYTRGVVEQKMIVSAGVSNPVIIPRIGNPCEVLRVDLD